MRTVYIYPRSLFPMQLPSNTLFGALCSAFSELGFDVDGLVNRYPDDPPFLVSSGFPCVRSNGGDVTHYFPMPVQPPTVTPQTSEEFKAMKSLKKARYMHESIFADLAGGRMKMADLTEQNDIVAGENPALLARRGEGEAWIRASALKPHNQINRMSMASQEIYHSEGYYYKEGCGFFALIDVRDPQWTDRIHAAFRFLEDRGFGGKISSGHGQATIEFGETDIPEGESHHLISLSRFIPRSLGDFGEDIWYSLVSVRGRSGDGTVKKNVLMLDAGAVFRNTGRRHYGRVVRVREKPPVVEYGMAFTIPWGGV